MKPKNPIRFAAILGLSIFSMASCKKKAQEDPGSPSPSPSSVVNRRAAVVRDSQVVVSINGTDRSSVVYRFTYNTDTTLQAIHYFRTSYTPSYQTSSSGISFTYLPGRIARRDTGYFASDTFRIDTLGRIYSFGGGFFDYYPGTNRVRYKYNGNEWFYNWGTDNLNYYIWISDTVHCEYYTDKSIGCGDGFQLQDMLTYGRSVIRNKNIIKSTSNSNTYYRYSTQYTYTYDDYGRIVQMTSVLGRAPTPTDRDTTRHFYTFEY